jgi:RNA polymerase sigma-70 factor, ECF subfamily
MLPILTTQLSRLCDGSGPDVRRGVTADAVVAYTGCVTDALTARPSFASVAEAHLDDVYRYLLYVTANPSTAEELTSATFERALDRWHRFDPKRGTAQTWLCQLARSAALDHFRAESRRRRREGAFAAQENANAAELELPDDYGPVLRQALRTLSAADREVVVLRVVLEQDAQTAARVLGISPSACTTRLNRALERLEQKVRPRLVA